MTSQKAKEYEALALSLALVNNDLRQKNFYRKSEFYQQSDETKKKLQAQIAAAENLSRELRTKTPQLSIMLNNAINNQPVDLLNINRIPIQQVNQPQLIEEIQRQAPSADELQAARLRPSPGPTQKVNLRDLIREQLKNLRPVEETKQETKQEETTIQEQKLEELDNRGLQLSNDFLEKQLTLEYVQLNGRTYPFFNQRIIDVMDRKQKIRAATRLAEILTNNKDNLNQNQKNKIKKAFDAIEKKIITRESIDQQKEDTEKPKQPKQPKLKRVPTPPVGPRPPIQSPKKDTGSVATSEPPSVIITRNDVATSQQVGMGMGMDYKKILPKKPTKDMKKLVLLIGSQRAGNNSEKLKKDIDVVFNRIKKDLTDKLNKAKK
jgi:hypothetical protein